MGDKILEIRDLTLHYGGSQILNGVSMTAALGEVTCVMGTNGVGKTSLLKAISGTHPRSGGSYHLDGQSIGKASAHALAQSGVAYVPQGREIFPFLTVRENLETGFACLPREEHAIPDEVFDLFPILKDFLSRRGGDLSGGQQQQLAIARVPRGRAPAVCLRLLRARGDMAIVLVEQFFDFAFGLGDQFVVLERGQVRLNERAGQIQRERLHAAVSV